MSGRLITPSRSKKTAFAADTLDMVRVSPSMLDDKDSIDRKDAPGKCDDAKEGQAAYQPNRTVGRGEAFGAFIFQQRVQASGPIENRIGQTESAHEHQTAENPQQPRRL